MSAPRVASSTALPLATLLGHAADAVAAVRAGRSLTEALAATPAAPRPGTQALAFQTLRRLGLALALRERLAPKPPPAWTDALLLTALALSPAVAGADAAPYAVHTLVDQAVQAARRRAPAQAGFVNAVLRRYLREADALIAAARSEPTALWNHPPWWIERLRADWPADWRALLHANDARAPMTLRVNAQRGSAAQYLERLAAAGLAARLQPLGGSSGPEGSNRSGGPNGPGESEGPDAPDGSSEAAESDHPGASSASRGLPRAARAEPAVELHAPCPVQALPGFATGDVSVQDAAAQRAAPLLLHAAPLAPGARVLDACAAPGGKTAHLLELRPDLDLLALDVDPARLAKVHETLDRLGLATPAVRLQAADAGDPAAWWDGRPFDAILLDAPCTASGIVRRHPDVRWLRRPGDVAALAATQARLLDALWPLLAPGGHLLYATCSVFRAEGEAQIDAFLQRRSAARRGAAPGHLLPLADNPEADATDRCAPADGFPDGSGDGFFYALLRRDAAD